MFEVLFSFPRFYFSLRLFGREFSLDLGWFCADIGGRQWRFGLSLTVLKVELTTETAYYCTLEFFAFTRHLLVSLGTCRYD